jgi:hypothetical protein
MGVKINFPQPPNFSTIEDVKKYLVILQQNLQMWENLVSNHRHLGVLNDFNTIASIKDWGKLSSAPSNPSTADRYYNTISNIQYIYDGTAWKNLW